MERALSQEERQRRAEEYYRRKNSINSIQTTTVNVNPKRNYKFFKKIVLQILICICIYALIFNLQKNTDSFSIDSIKYLKNMISYDINMNNFLENLKNNTEIFNFTSHENKVDNTISDKPVEENVIDNKAEATLSASEQVTEEVNKEGESKNTVTEEASSVSQIEENAQYIKNNFSFIKPLTTGVVTSRFGLRNPTTATVPKYHTGIDIGVPEGTVIISAMQGTVELVSSVGDYRKSY